MHRTVSSGYLLSRLLTYHSRFARSQAGGSFSGISAGPTSWTPWQRSVGARQLNGPRTSRQYRTSQKVCAFRIRDAWCSPVLRTAYTPEASDALWVATVAHLQRWGQTTAEDARALVELLRRMLVVDPVERPSASALLQDSYFALAPNGGAFIFRVSSGTIRSDSGGQTDDC